MLVPELSGPSDPHRHLSQSQRQTATRKEIALEVFWLIEKIGEARASSRGQSPKMQDHRPFWIRACWSYPKRNTRYRCPKVHSIFTVFHHFSHELCGSQLSCGFALRQAYEAEKEEDLRKTKQYGDSLAPCSSGECRGFHCVTNTGGVR